MNCRENLTLTDDNCALLGYHAASSDSFLPTVLDKPHQSAVLIYFAAEARNHALLAEFITTNSLNLAARL